MNNNKSDSKIVTFGRSLVISLQTYSRIPMPQVNWTDRAMKWIMCFFPLVGAVIGGLEILWFYLAGILHLSSLIYGAVASVIPFLVTGGIHMDGYCDTVDALSSHQSRERMLEILKDSNAGAFAIIFGAVWILLDFAGWTAIADYHTLVTVSLGFILSRALSGLAASNFRLARENGMLKSMAEKGRIKTVSLILLAIGIVCMACMVVTGGWLGLLIAVVNIIIFMYYRYLAYKKFGGTTGDLAGWFLQLAELGTILSAAILGSVL